jgi:putative ABC transport system permease protein
MLIGDRAKFFALLFGVAFATLLMAQQTAFCIGLISLSGNGIREISTADVWVMRSGTPSADLALPMPSQELFRVRGAPGVKWAVPYFKGAAVVRSNDGKVETVGLIGVDDASLIGLPLNLKMGTAEDLRQPDSIIVNVQGFKRLFPGQELGIGGTFELNDKRAKIVGLVNSKPLFGIGTVAFTRFSNINDFARSARNNLNLILVGVSPENDPEIVAKNIEASTGLQALTRAAFVSKSIDYVVSSTSIVPSFGIVVFLGLIVGAVIVFLTLSLFIRDNLKQLGALRAIGVGNATIIQMVLCQAAFIGILGYGIGIGLTAIIIEAIATNAPDLSTMYLPMVVIAGSAIIVALFVTLAALISVRKVLRMDPATAFRG